MAWSGGVFTRTNGTYSGSSVWASDLSAGIKIVAARHDIHDQDLATGINACLNKNGQNSPTANINWGNFKITNLGTANANGQAVEYSQLAGKQDASTVLNSIDGAGIVADQGFYGTSADNVGVYALTAAARTFSAAVDAAAQRVVIGAQARSPAIQSVASSATVTPTFSDDEVIITAQAAALNLANPTGTAIDGLGIVIRIKDNGTARAITYGTNYRAIGVTLPTTTVISKTLYLGMIYNATDTKWDVVSVVQQA